MSESIMGYVYFYGFWAVGIMSCLAALLAVFVIARAIRQRDR